MSRAITREEMYEVINHLQDTCLSLDEGISQVLGNEGFESVEGMMDIDNEMEFCSVIDDTIFMCSRCGWWCEAGDWITDENPNYDEDEEICTQCGND